MALADCFVDFVESRQTGEQVHVMCPGREVESRLEQTPLRGKLLSELYQHEDRVLDNDFPYQEMTLAQVGIPARDVLKVHTEQRDLFVELKMER